MKKRWRMCGSLLCALKPAAVFVQWVMLGVGASGVVHASLDRTLQVPAGNPSADEVARQVYFANHFYAFDNFSIKGLGRRMAVLINRDADGDVGSVGVERYLKNDYDDSEVASRDLAIFRSGKLRGTGLLVTEYRDAQKSSTYSIWLPALRKVRRFAEPEQDESWGGSVFTFGDVSLRRPDQETHELLGKKQFRTCLGVIEAMEGKSFKHAGRLPKRTCRHIDKMVYGLKSRPKTPEWWYDYRISFVDTESFADYRTVYFKNDELIKVIDRDWGVVTGIDTKDPRALFWKSWYGADLRTGRESWAVIPQDSLEINSDRDATFWSERTLRRLKR
jgi:hypothetical protein